MARARIVYQFGQLVEQFTEQGDDQLKSVKGENQLEILGFLFVLQPQEPKTVLWVFKAQVLGV